MFICAGESEQFDFAMPVGIGLMDTAINLTKMVLSEKPKELIFVGTAGSYGDKKVFDIITSYEAVNIENSYFNAGAYTPIVSRETSFPREGSCSSKIVVNSSNYITTDARLGKYYIEKGIAVENMEFYAVMKVAKAFDIPAEGILIVTNYCNENAHRDFLKNHKEAMEKLDIYVKKMIKEQMAKNNAANHFGR
ncbi:purine-nucleoside phosphorylase [Sulfurovum sp.]|uniref:phosphorylase family protein n=1 Tax=Sulfurovum sp. TaxID=1969726 RepID=UPI0025ECEA6C|nr:purine-nucleoside phosphorylase [Sulfurovum sp.]